MFRTMNELKTRWNALRVGARIVVAYVTLLATFSLLNLVAYCIPTPWMGNQIRSSAATLAQEGIPSRLMAGSRTMQSDNFTTALMLNIAMRGSDDPLHAAFDNPYYVGASTTQSEPHYLVAALDVDTDMAKSGEDGWESYARYWNGYLCILKPLLCIFDLSQIRGLLYVLFSLLLFAATCLLARREGVFPALAFAVPFVLLHYGVAIVSFITTYAFFLAVLGVLYVLRAVESKGFLCAGGWETTFFVLGGLTAYFDSLSVPVITLGVPLAVLVYLSRKSMSQATLKSCLSSMMLVGICWGLGYASLWVSKWMVSSLVLGRSVFDDALGKVGQRLGTVVDEGAETQEIPRLAVPLYQIVYMLPVRSDGTTSGLFPWLLVISLPLLVRRERRRKADGEDGDRRMAVLLALVALIPYLWYCAAANHSLIHAWFAHRAQLVTLVCVCLYVAGKMSPASVVQGTLSQTNATQRGEPAKIKRV